MEKEATITTKFKLKFPKFFSSSCISHDISKLIHHPKPVFTPKSPLLQESKQQGALPQEEEEHDDEDYNHGLRPKHSSTSLLACKPRCPDSFDQMVRESCLIPTAGRYRLLSPAGKFSGRRCPPASPASPLFLRQPNTKKKKKKKTKKKEKIKKKKSSSKNGGFVDKLEKTNFKNRNPFSLSSSNETDWFSSDDEREEQEQEEDYDYDEERERGTLVFSSKSHSLSSDSEPHRETHVANRARMREKSVGVGSKMKSTFAVVKNSSDPYSDFRTSMVEMIVEKQIFGERELEQLLHCFLSLNSPHHHTVIVEVFSEICDALFSYRS